MMSELPDLNNGDEKSPDPDQSSIDWLEQLADEPDAIWGNVTADAAVTGEPEAKKEAADTEIPGRAGHDSKTQPSAGAGRNQAAVYLEPTVESPSATREQAQSLVRSLEEDEMSAADSDLAAEETEDVADRATIPNDHNEMARAATDAAGDEGRAEAKSTRAGQDAADYSDELVLEIDDLMWLDDMEKVPEMKKYPSEDDERPPAGENEVSLSDDVSSEDPGEARPASSLDTNLDQVPDDPDEAIAWLERLAAKQGAPAEELPTVDFISAADAIEAGPEGKFSLEDMDAGEIPEDPDEAMAWLEMLAAKEVASGNDEFSGRAAVENGLESLADERTALEPEPTAEALSADLDEALEESLPGGLDEALDWLEELTLEPGDAEPVAMPEEALTVVEEPPTPAVAHHLDETLAGADLLFAEPQTGEQAEDTDQRVDELPYDEADDAMAWLEQLAARQGAPIEELTTVDAEPEGLAQDVEADQEVAEDVSETIDDAAIGTLPDVGKAPVEEAMELEPEQLSSDEAVDAAMVSADPIADTTPEAVDELEIAAAEPATTEAPDYDEHGAEEELERPAEPEPTEVEIADEPGEPAQDLAWLDTLGAVDAERWLEAEAADQLEERVAVSEPASDEDLPLELDDRASQEVQALFGPFPSSPASEALAEARQAMEEGNFEDGLTRYTALVEGGQDLAFLIDDLEAISEQRGPEPALQRVLGDAYARNGQLRKALESYREALANL